MKYLFGFLLLFSGRAYCQYPTSTILPNKATFILWPYCDTVRSIKYIGENGLMFDLMRLVKRGEFVLGGTVQKVIIHDTVTLKFIPYILPNRNCSIDTIYKNTFLP